MSKSNPLRLCLQVLSLPVRAYVALVRAGLEKRYERIPAETRTENVAGAFAAPAPATL